jgi:hypothetical protein
MSQMEWMVLVLLLSLTIPVVAHGIMWAFLIFPMALEEERKFNELKREYLRVWR